MLTIGTIKSAALITSTIVSFQLNGESMNIQDVNPKKDACHTLFEVRVSLCSGQQSERGQSDSPSCNHVPGYLNTPRRDAVVLVLSAVLSGGA